MEAPLPEVKEIILTTVPVFLHGVYRMILVYDCLRRRWIQCCLKHCKEIRIYVFPERELLGLSPNFHIHVSVSDLYIPTFGPPIYLQQNWHTDQRNKHYKSLTET
jgi:hypothetical protein